MKNDNQIRTQDVKHIHSFTDKVITPTCCQHGYTLHTCACGYEYKDKFTSTAEHDFQLINVERSNCSKEGKKEYRCRNCSAYKEEPIPADKHVFGDWTVLKKATCSQNGIRQRRCINCEKVETEQIQPIGHDWTDWNTQIFPTCTEAGIRTRYCLICDKAQKQEIPAIGHKFTEWEPLISENGKWERFCENCGKIEVKDDSEPVEEIYINEYDYEPLIRAEIIAPLIPILIVAIIILTTTVFIPGIRYHKATNLYRWGYYEEAIAAFSELEEYRDSKEQIELCKVGIIDDDYNAALDLYNSGKYEEAVSAFAALNGYKESNENIELCKEKIKAKEYTAAVSLFDSGDYEEALVAFQELNGYEKSNDYIKICIKENDYLNALKLYNQGKYDEAIIAFTELDGYKDSTVLIKYSELNMVSVGDTVLFGTYFQTSNQINGNISTESEYNNESSEYDDETTGFFAESSSSTQDKQNCFYESNEDFHEPETEYLTDDIEWQVLAKKDDSILLVSKYALSFKPYDNNSSDDWENSSLREWLNSDFYYSAFDSCEQNMIKSVWLDQEKNANDTSTTSTASSYDTNVDYTNNSDCVNETNAECVGTDESDEYISGTYNTVFILSADEAETLLDEKICTSTEYAICQGADSNCRWWLRSQGNGYRTVAFVDTNGNINKFGISPSNSAAVRPAIWVKLSGNY